MISWAVYDLTADDMIGSWSDYRDCIAFCLDNQGKEDNWEIFPEEECFLAVK